MRSVKITTCTAMLLALTLASVDAAPQGRKPASSPKQTAKAPKAPKTTAITTTTTKAPKAPKATANVSKAPKTTTVTTTKATKATKADAKLARAESKATKKAGTTAIASETTLDAGGVTPTVTTVDFTAGPVGERLAKNSALRSKLETRLLALGYTGTVYQAAYGFKNQGQFVAATNAARNLGTPLAFEQIKLQMTGLSVDAAGVVLKANLGADGTVTMVDPAAVTAAAPTKSLGQAIQTVTGTVDATAAAQTATTQADAEIQSTTTTVSR